MARTRTCFARVPGKITKLNTTFSWLVVVSEQRSSQKCLIRGPREEEARIKIVSRFLLGYLSKLRKNQLWLGFHSSEPQQAPRAQSPWNLCWQTFSALRNLWVSYFRISGNPCFGKASALCGSSIGEQALARFLLLKSLAIPNS